MDRFDSLHDPLEFATSMRVHDDLLVDQAKLYIVSKFLFERTLNFPQLRN